MTPSVKATNLLDRFWNGVLPIDPNKIAEKLDIRVLPLSSHDVQSGLSGALHWYPSSDATDRVLYCRYNDTESLQRQRFTIAHEIGHFALGHMQGHALFRDPTEVFTGRVHSPQEVEANQFAAALLMPEKMVKALIGSGVNTLRSLATRFEVSESAMRWRLVNLGLLSAL